MSYLEAAGWLAHAYVWIHPTDLALRESGGATSYGAAARCNELATVLPGVANLASNASQVHVVFNNCYANYGTTNALEIADMVRARYADKENQAAEVSPRPD